MSLPALALVAAALAAAPPAPAAAPATPFELALTVDDLPSHGSDVPGLSRLAIAQRLLAVFKQHGLPPVYGFVNAGKLEGHPERKAVLDAWHAAKNPLGNHGYSHLSLTASEVPAYVADIERDEALLGAYGPAEELRVYRYPFLLEGETKGKRDQVRAWLSAHRYRIAQVSIDGDDWAWNEPYARCAQAHDQLKLGLLRRSFLDAQVRYVAHYRALARLLLGREPRHVLLLHVGAMDADQMDALLSSLEATGARFITLDRALEDPLYALDHGVATKSGSTLLDKLALAKGEHGPAFAWPDEKWLEGVCR